MHWLKVLGSPSPVIVNSHLPAVTRSAARRGGVAARKRPQAEVRRRVLLRIVVDFMGGAYTGSGHPALDASKARLATLKRLRLARRRQAALQDLLAGE